MCPFPQPSGPSPVPLAPAMSYTPQPRPSGTVLPCLSAFAQPPLQLFEGPTCPPDPRHSGAYALPHHSSGERLTYSHLW